MQLSIGEFRASSYNKQMKMVSNYLSGKIKDGTVLESSFSEAQLKAIHAGKAKVPN